ncbi:MAG: hypothetical protein H3Z53_11300 [archaeon]|nr:hypothetical protein [archaeon]
MKKHSVFILFFSLSVLSTLLTLALHNEPAELLNFFVVLSPVLVVLFLMLILKRR